MLYSSSYNNRAPMRRGPRLRLAFQRASAHLLVTGYREKMQSLKLKPGFNTFNAAKGTQGVT
jgi:hypothetical protein